ncbi:MAG: hypothetical protein ABI668_06240 [Sphingorhabdus sp.]
MPWRICPIVSGLQGGYVNAMTNAFLSIAMIAGFLLLFGAYRQWRYDGLVKQVWLMIIAALVLFANVAVWVVPDKQGRSLVSEDMQAPN